MKEKIKNLFCIVIVIFLMPYVVTVLCSGDMPSNQRRADSEKIKAVVEEVELELDLEEYVIGVLAAQMPVDYEPETLKAQAVISRTNILKQWKEKGEALTFDCFSSVKMAEIWGYDKAVVYYKKMEDAVLKTKGEVLCQNGTYIEASYHAVSSGKTRNGNQVLNSEEYPYLVSADSSFDVTAKNYMKITVFEKKELAEKLNQWFEVSLQEKKLMEELKILERDETDYVSKVKLGEKTVSGEEFRKCLALNSSCFQIEEFMGKIRMVTKGLGHGLGLSQYGANCLALKGNTYREILNYYYKDIEIRSE